MCWRAFRTESAALWSTFLCVSFFFPPRFTGLIVLYGLRSCIKIDPTRQQLFTGNIDLRLLESTHAGCIFIACPPPALGCSYEICGERGLTSVLRIS